MKRRILYIAIVLLTICCGIFVRKCSAYFPEWINFWLGDALYAFMMFFIVAFCINKKQAILKAFITIVICYCIEFSQLWHGEWIDHLRQTLPGRLVLGQGFLWTDLVAYLVGIIAAYSVETLWFHDSKSGV